MNPLRTLETMLASLVEGAFGRVFRSEVRPMELARKLAREMDEHRTASVSRVYAPNEYAVWLSPEDRARYEGVEHELIDELSAYLLEHARAEQLTLVSPPAIAFHTDTELSLGEFGIQARLVRLDGEDGEREDGWGPDPNEAPPHPDNAPPAPKGASPRPAVSAAAASTGGVEDEEHGRTMIWSASRRLRGPLEQARAGRPATDRRPRALLLLDSRRMLVAPSGAVIGRSRDCDIVLEDAGVSRRHARIGPDAQGWTIEDLGSTNGVRVNDEQIHGACRLRLGDRIEVGSTRIVFELR